MAVLEEGVGKTEHFVVLYLCLSISMGLGPRNIIFASTSQFPPSFLLYDRKARGG